MATNPRVVKEATALSEAGHIVTIVCGHFISSAIQTDIDLALPAWDVRGITFGRRVASFPRHFRQRARQAIAGVLIKAGAGSDGLALAAYGPVGPDLKTAVLSIRADLYIAHYVEALPAAANAARRYGACYAFDAEDFHLGDLPDIPKYAFEKKLIRTIEGRYLPAAAYVTAAAPLIADAYVKTYGIRRPTVVLNTFPRSHAPAAPMPAGTARPRPSVYWFSQTIGPGRGLEPALDAIAMAASKPHLYLRGKPAAGYRNVLEEQARRLGVVDRLHFLDPVSPCELERAGTAYDMGYVGETGETRNRAIALTNKLFSYLTSGLPMTASEIPSHRDLAPQLADVMSVHAIGDAACIARDFDALLLDQDRLAIARARAWSLGQGAFSWEKQAPIILESLADSVSRR